MVGILNGTLHVEPHPPLDVQSRLATAEAPVDFAEVRGQEAVKRAIVVACAGSHNLVQLWPRAGNGSGVGGSVNERRARRLFIHGSNPVTPIEQTRWPRKVLWSSNHPVATHCSVLTRKRCEFRPTHSGAIPCICVRLDALV